MQNTWLIMPIISNDVNLSELVKKLTGNFVAPNTYEKMVLVDNNFVPVTTDHPFAGQSVDLSNKIVFINTKPGYTTYDGVLHIEDFGDFNIYRYLNSGINYAIEHGAEQIAIANGALDFDPTAIKMGYDAMISENVDLVDILGHALILLSSNLELRFDEQFKLWFGDNDFYRRAPEIRGSVNADFNPLPIYLIDNQSIENWQEIAKEDELKYDAKWS